MTSITKRHLRTIFLALTLPLMFVGGVSAGEIFKYESTCSTNCASIGLSPGGAVSGTIGISDSVLGTGQLTDISQVESFELHFGNLNFGLGSLAFASGLLDPQDSDVFAIFAFASIGGVEPGFNFDQNVWFAGSSNAPATGGPGTLTASTSVPEPATLALLGVAIAGLGFARRRKLH